MNPIQSVNEIIVYLADNEWGNVKMLKVARKVADQHPDVENLMIRVYEHAGWSLAWFRDGDELYCVGSANGQAIYQGKQKQIIDQIAQNKPKWAIIKSIRRQTKQVYVASGA